MCKSDKNNIFNVNTSTIILQPFYGSLDFVWEYLGELVQKPIWISWSNRQ